MPATRSPSASGCAATNGIAKCGITDSAVGPTSAASGRDRHVAPAEELQPLLVGDALDQRDGSGSLVGVRGQEGDAGGVGVRAVRGRLGQVEVDDRAQQLVGQLQQDSGAVAAGRLGAGGAAVLEVGQRHEGVGDDLVGAPPLDVGDHGHATRVTLGGRVVKTLRSGDGRKNHASTSLVVLALS